MKQREIKFRVFDIVTSTMYNCVNQIIFELQCVLAQPNEDSTVDEETEIGFERCVLMQFTGLKDKNGVEIYEGDLIKNVGTPKLKQVVYHDQAFYLREGNAHTRLSKLNFDGEIIGNIHEHKHLLK